MMLQMSIRCALTIVFVIFSLVLKKINGSDDLLYSTKTPYQFPSSFIVLPSAPFDYEHVCTQILARHASRTLLSKKYENPTMFLWNFAFKENALTDLGYELGRDVFKYVTLNDFIGFVSQYRCLKASLHVSPFVFRFQY